MSNWKKALVALGAVALIAGTSACEAGDTSREKEDGRKSESYDNLVAKQPAEPMTYSPTRDTINFWTKTWNKKNKLSYVYLQNANGDMIGYYVLKGLPVSYCAQLTPVEKVVTDNEDNDNWEGSENVVVSTPAMDGVYYSTGGSCDTYYGQDATTGAYLEYTAGMGINVLLYDKPLPKQDAEPLGPTSVEDVKNS